MAGIEDCGSFNFILAKPTVKVGCQLIITEIADPEDSPFHRFVAIYALNEEYWDKDVATDDEYLVI